MNNSFGSVVSIGYNGLPRGMNDNDERYQNKTLPLTPANPFYKYDLFEHAERNCLYNFARTNTQLNHDDNYMIVSHISNAEEMRAIVSSGIKKVYFETINDDIVHLLIMCSIILHLNATFRCTIFMKKMVINLILITIPTQNKLRCLKH